jgi:hypothetical protein
MSMMYVLINKNKNKKESYICPSAPLGSEQENQGG